VRRDRGETLPRTARDQAPSRLARTDQAEPRTTHRSMAVDRGRVLDSRNRTTLTSRDNLRTARTTQDGTFTQRSTLGGDYTTRSSHVRAGTTTPHASLPQTREFRRSTYVTQRHGGYYGGYRGHWAGWHSPWYYSGVSFGFGIGFRAGFFGFGFVHHPHWYVWHSPFVSYTRWGIARITVRGWYGYHFGHRCYYWSHRGWRYPRWHRYRGYYCRVTVPYWYGYSRWYDWRPHRYGYTALSYERIYDRGYGDGYQRGYVDGAEDVSAYRDDRRRDSIAERPRPRTPDPSQDRHRADAATEYRVQMNRGDDAFSKGDFRAATRAFREAVVLSPNSSDARYSLAVSAFAEGKYAFSAFALRRGITLTPDDSNIDITVALGGPSNLESHIGMLERELNQHPEDPDLLLLRGFVALNSGDARTAAEMLDRALAALPSDQATKHLHQQAMTALENQ
jgi:hypothetical protein